MKDKKERAASSAAAAAIGSSSSTTSYQLKTTTLNGMRALLIRKNNTTTKNNQHPEDLLLGSIKEFLLYSKLKSLIPPSFAPPLQERSVDNEMRAVEVELDPHECLHRDSLSDEENPSTSTVVPCVEHQMLSKDHNKDEQMTTEDRQDNEDMCNVECVIEEEDDEGIARSFKPSIKIRRMDDSIHISTIVLKDVSMTSTLFHILEEDKLDVVCEDQYRTETKVAHNIQVRIRPGYDIDGLEKKLQSWAGYST